MTKKYFGSLFPADNDSLSESFIKNLTYKDSISSSAIRYNLCRLFREGDYTDLEAVIKGKNRYSVLKIEGITKPPIQYVNVMGTSLINQNKIDSVFSNIIRKPYNADQVVSDLIDLVNLYRKRGYSLAEIRNVKFNEAEGTLSQVRVGDMRSEGFQVCVHALLSHRQLCSHQMGGVPVLRRS